MNLQAVVHKFFRVKSGDARSICGGARDLLRDRDLGISLDYTDWRVS